MFMDLPHTVTVESVTTAKDTSGGTTETYATRQAAVACLITQQKGKTEDRFDAQRKVQMHTVSMTYASTTPGDRLLVTTGPSNVLNKYLYVVGITRHDNPLSGIDAYSRLACEQLLE